MLMIEDLYIFCYGLALLLLSFGIVTGMTVAWVLVIMHFQNKKKEGKEDESEEEKRRKRNEEIINKYMR